MTELDFQLTYFSGRNCRIQAWKTGFLVFSQDLLISVYWFFVQKCVIAMAKTLPIPILKKTLFWPKMPEIYFLSHKYSYSNSQYFVKIAGTADCRAGKTDFLQFLESSQYFIHEFLLYSFAHSFIRLLVRLFVFQYLFH